MINLKENKVNVFRRTKIEKEAYRLNNLSTLNDEIESNPYLVAPYLLRVKKVFEIKNEDVAKSKEVTSKIKNTFSTIKFGTIDRFDIDRCNESLDTFSKYRGTHYRYKYITIIAIVSFSILMMYLTKWIVFWSIPIVWSFLNILIKRSTNKKEKKWFAEARFHVECERNRNKYLRNNNK